MATSTFVVFNEKQVMCTFTGKTPSYPVDILPMSQEQVAGMKDKKYPGINFKAAIDNWLVK